MKSSQKQNILRHLLYGPLCGQEQDWSLGRRIPARIYQLRENGFTIEKRKCAQGHSHRTHQWEYYLDVKDPSVFVDWCAHCGEAGTLVHTNETASRTVDGFTWLPMKCSECGKGDWR